MANGLGMLGGSLGQYAGLMGSGLYNPSVSMNQATPSSGGFNLGSLFSRQNLPLTLGGGLLGAGLLTSLGSQPASLSGAIGQQRNIVGQLGGALEAAQQRQFTTAAPGVQRVLGQYQAGASRALQAAQRELAKRGGTGSQGAALVRQQALDVARGEGDILAQLSEAFGQRKQQEIAQLLPMYTQAQAGLGSLLGQQQQLEAQQRQGLIGGLGSLGGMLLSLGMR